MFILKELKETRCDVFLLQTKIWKTHPNKSPLTLHPTGRFCKKIRGKLYYFGTDNMQADS